MKKRYNTGITLVALVLTIIILLILAGISISALTNTGIFGKAQEAKEKTEKANELERIYLCVINSEIGENGYNGINKESLQKHINSEFGEGKINVIDNSDGTLILRFISEDKEYEVNANGNIKMIEKIKDNTPGYLDGDGTVEKPYLIESVEDLVAFAENVKNGNTYSDKVVTLKNDLDLSSSLSYVDTNKDNLKEKLTTEGFDAIGTISNLNREQYTFAGNFDGNGKKIKNVIIKSYSESTTEDIRIGLFGNNNGVIKNLGLINCNITGTLNTTGNNTVIVGGITGYNYGEINGCYVTGKISGEGQENAKCRVGGIAGDTTQKIYNCYNKANINATGSQVTCAGGITAVTSPNSEIKKCYNIGDVYTEGKGGTVETIAGIIGYADSETIIENCYNCGKIEMNAMETRDICAGGITGYGINIYVDNCCNIGKINVNTESKSNIGGISGTKYSNENGKGNIKNSYYLNTSALLGIGTNNADENEDKITKVDNQKDMPSILEIIGDKFKRDENNTNNGYPILNWQ